MNETDSESAQCRVLILASSAIAQSFNQLGVWLFRQLWYRFHILCPLSLDECGFMNWENCFVMVLIQRYWSVADQ
jgi:hypothetical protein